MRYTPEDTSGRRVESGRRRVGWTFFGGWWIGLVLIPELLGQRDLRRDRISARE